MTKIRKTKGKGFEKQICRILYPALHSILFSDCFSPTQGVYSLVLWTMEHQAQLRIWLITKKLSDHMHAECHYAETSSPLPHLATKIPVTRPLPSRKDIERFLSRESDQSKKKNLQILMSESPQLMAYPDTRW